MLLSPIRVQDLLRVGESVVEHRRGSGQAHYGIDLYARPGSPVLAAIQGVVLRVVNGLAGLTESLQRAGWFVDIAGLDGTLYRYLHVGEKPVVREGEFVRAGAQIGIVGTSGIHHAKPHVHFEIRKSDYDSNHKHYGEPINPLTVLPLQQYRDRGILVADIDWRGILDKAIDIGGPILGTVINLEAPGAGTLVSGGLQVVKKMVVDEYLPGAPPATSGASPAGAPPASGGAPPPKPSSPDDKAAIAFLVSKGWNLDEIEHHFQTKQEPAREDDVRRYSLPYTEPEHGAHIVHGTLSTAGWQPADRRAILRGPDAFRQHLQSGIEVRDRFSEENAGHAEDIVVLGKPRAT